MKKIFALTGLSMLTVPLLVIQPMHSSSAQSCVPLREVTTKQRSLRKVIELNNSNANTDFAVPTGTRFSSYIARVIPENNSDYKVEVNLKYNDGSSAQAVSRSISARRFYLYNQPLQSPTTRQPFQINTRITGSRNTAYQVAVLACR